MTPRVISTLQGGAAIDGAFVVCAFAEAQQWAGATASPDAGVAPPLARRLREAGAAGVCIVGIVHPDGRRLRWLDTAHARGWLLSAPGEPLPVDASRFATNLSEALNRGFVPADAAVVAAMAHGVEGSQYISDPQRLPLLSWGEAPAFAPARAAAARTIGLYPLVDSAERLQQVLGTGIRTVQLRIKTPPVADAAWHGLLRDHVQRSIAACRAAGADLYVNDHWRLAIELGAYGVHLGQEDLARMAEDERAALAASGVALGVSSHSLWELARARALAPGYIACGPVWPTLTKDMPWVAQGMDNLSWWCRMAGAPVVAIGGILGPEEVRQAARCGADGVCIVRGLGDRPQETVPPLQAALDAGRADQRQSPHAVGWPHPSLAAD